MIASSARRCCAFLHLLAVAAAVASMPGCRDAQDAAAPPPPAVTVAKPVTESVANYLDFTGNTAATQKVTVVARVEGYLEKIHFTDGQQVKKGDLLFTIQQAQYQAQLKKAQAQVAVEKAALWHATTELRRYTDLVRQDAATQTQVDHWRTEKEQARARLLAAQAQVEIAQLTLGYTLVRAPIAGRIGRHLVDTGNLVGGIGQPTSLAEIEQIDPIHVYFTIDQRELLRLIERQKTLPRDAISSGLVPATFGLLTEEGHPHQGHLDFAAIGIAPTTGTLQVRGVFANRDQRILPGLFARLRVSALEPKDALLGKTAGVRGWVTIGGYSALDSAKLANAVTTFVIYDDWDRRPPGFSQLQLIGELQQKFKSIPQASFAVLPPSPIPGLGVAFGFQMMIEDRAGLGARGLQAATNELLRRASDEPGFLRLAFTTFSADSPQLLLDLDRNLARALGVPVDEVFRTVQTHLGSSYVNLFNQFNQSFQVRVQADGEYRRSVEDIRNLAVANRSGQMVPLGVLADLRPMLGPELIYRFNLYPAAALIGIPTPKYSSGEALGRMHDLASATLPPGMAYEWTGLAYQEKLIGNQSYLLFALSIVLVFLVLAAQYESWTDPLAVVLTVPMALVGIVIALLLRRFPIDIYTQIGLVLMTALAAKNAILIVEFARLLTAAGMAPTEAAIEATRRRFRPIVMTSLAFILGVVPLLTATGAGAASQQALGTVVFGGMLASTFLAIPFVAVFYVLLHRPAASGSTP
ncbi:MAG TPA: efflux RND transporter permease subunit [Candidatus Accumulibacter phosphatis]|nr:efflux RND transporter permease subunit [Candidatus Accumulibacter phosphatis]HRQ95172.1 efflux RND transporter permease subunit [Candidatus Accumulibacter phosphatis]